MLIGGRRYQAPEGDGDGGGATITPERAAEIARAAALEAAAPLAEKIAFLEGRNSAAPPVQPPAPPKVYTRTELATAVAERRMTEDQATDILERQRADETRRIVQETVSGAFTDLRRGNVVEQGLNEYQRLKPDAWKAGTKDRERVEAQYKYLVSIGQPATAATELVALQTVYGPVDALRSAASGRDDFESMEDIGGGGSGGGRRDGGGGGGKPKLTPRERAHYERLIDRGVYADWDAVHAELKFARKRGAAA